MNQGVGGLIYLHGYRLMSCDAFFVCFFDDLAAKFRCTDPRLPPTALRRATWRAWFGCRLQCLRYPHLAFSQSWLSMMAITWRARVRCFQLMWPDLSAYQVFMT